jgi:hypothetical protein
MLIETKAIPVPQNERESRGWDNRDPNRNHPIAGFASMTRIRNPFAQPSFSQSSYQSRAGWN